MAEFVHLHVHTQYSMLEGALTIKALLGRTRALGMSAVAMTDHGNMHGAIELYKKSKDAGVQPILGCELAFLYPGDRYDKAEKKHPRSYHLPLLASTEEGYKNLIALVSHAWREGPDGNPMSTLERLAEHAKGLVVLTGCLGGVVPQALLQHSPEEARRVLGLLKDLVDPGALYVELQDHGLVEQPIVNRLLLELARGMALPVVATNDVTYLRREDAQAQRALTCIAAGVTLEHAEHSAHGSEEMYLKGPDEMAELFAEVPEALENTLAIRERCALKLTLDKPSLPRFKDEGGAVVTDADEYFARLSREGLEQRFQAFRRQGKAFDERKYRDRLEVEIAVITAMKFPGYFLIVQDFINWGKNNGVPVGPGRGSGAGSLVAYALRITDLDPIPYDLLFERFLNPERVSMPDFDVDFCMLKRERVIEYVRGKYGRDSVGQIATFQVLKAKSCVRDVGRVLGLSFAETDAIARLVPDPEQGKTIPLKDALDKEPRLRALYEESEQARSVIDLAQKLEGMTRHAGMHAAGIVISEGPLWHTVPVFRAPNGELVTQYAKDEVEAAGLVKFDFLGLTTLTVLDFAVNLIGKRPDRDGRPFILEDIALDGKPQNLAGEALREAQRARETYELLASGETTGVFQLESSGMQKLFKDLRPDCFEDIVAAVALYRPGPLGTGMVEDFVNRKLGKTRVVYPHDDLKEILETTYGVIVYQEQVMMIARRMGGYSLGGADLLRRAMGKKKAEEMAKQKSTFLEGATRQGYEEAKAAEIFDLLEYFAGYGFNKCVVAETVLQDAESGAQTTVGELFQRRQPMKVHALGDDGRLHPRAVTDVVRNGRKRVYELRTAQGRAIVATDNHPFRTLDGWTELKDLRPGDRIAAPRRLAVASSKRWPEHELVALGWLLSEGNTCHPTSLYFYNNTPAAVDDFVTAARAFPHSEARIHQRRSGRYEVCVNTGRDPWLRGHLRAQGPAARPEGATFEPLASGAAPLRSGAFWWAQRLGLLGVKATEKRVPEEVFTLCDDDLAVLLGRLWSGDGFFANRTNYTPFYATSSERLAYDVQNLLLRLGILSGVHRKTFRYRGGVRSGFTVHLVGDGTTEAFLARVAPHCVGRDAQLAQLRAHLASRSFRWSSKDTVPCAVRRWVDEDRRALGLTWGDLEERSGLSTRAFQGAGSPALKGYCRGTIAGLAGALGSERLAREAHSEVFWDRVVSITPRGVEETYDLTVEVDHNFVADGLIVHNSHSAAYALITYQTAYLKRHYPAEFMCATLCSDLGKSEKLVGTIAEARAMGIPVLTPDVNESDRVFTVVYAPARGQVPKKIALPIDRDPWKPRIRVGLGGIKGVGDSAIEAILEARSQGTFKDFFDFASRVDVRRCNKGVFEALIHAGAFDDLLGRAGASRAQAHEAIDSALERGRGAARERSSGQLGLFGLAEVLAHTSGFPEVPPWDLQDKLRRERVALGLYLTGHPLDRYAAEVGRVATAQAAGVSALDNGAEVSLAGVIEGYRERVPKSGGRMAFFHLEDRSGRVECIVRARAYEAVSSRLKEGEAVLLAARVKVDFPRDEEGNVVEDVAEEALERKLMVDDVTPLGDALRQRTKRVTLRLDGGLLLGGETLRRRLTELKQALTAHPGTCPVNAVVKTADGAEVTVSLPRVRIDPTEDFLAKLERIFGGKVAELRA
ncbi:MAG: DNA polymerase III subunit alpha [Deltaproteobacteria bacterium]|nr:DNA polymerase III subunit alpha [Deltaproteobacteria bacterium]